MNIQSVDVLMDIFGYKRIPEKMIFGSSAIKFWYPIYNKEPNDVDYITYNHIKNEKGIEYHQVDLELYKLVLKYNNSEDTEYLDPNLLYTIKCSHIAWEGKNGKWWHHLKDIVFLKRRGCVIHKEVFDSFYNLWEIKFGDKSHISLNKATEMFFKDGVHREYDHDWLHEYFKVGDKPAYTRALFSKHSPIMSSYVFSTLSKKEQLYCALEEMFVVSFERNTSLPNAYKKLVTSMTKGWFNLFLIENAEILLDGFLEEKTKFKKTVNELKERK